MSYIADYGTRLRVQGAEHAARRQAFRQASLEDRMAALEERVTELEAAQRIEARSDETPQVAQPEGREPGPKDAPK